MICKQATCAFLTPSKPHLHNETAKADVAELADAQVSEACDGDIVEVQVLSSAPTITGEPVNQTRPSSF